MAATDTLISVTQLARRVGVRPSKVSLFAWDGRLDGLIIKSPGGRARFLESSVPALAEILKVREPALPQTTQRPMVQV
jgi:hypothetical protein